MPKKLTIEYIRSEVEKRNGTLLSEVYVNAKTPLKIRCNVCLHEWDPIWSRIQQNHWCRKCAGKCPPTIEEVRLFVESKNGTLLSKVYINNSTPLDIRCNICLYEWSPDWHHMQQGQWCPNCAGNVPPTIEYIKQFVESKNGTLLSKVYINAYLPLDIRCNICLCEWSPVWHDMQKNRWCPNCASWKTQRLLQSILEKIFGIKAKTNYKGFDWLKTKNGKQELDIYFPQLKMAIEYDGKQHFKIVEYWGGKKAFKRTKQLDRLKNKKIKQHPEDIKYFIRFNYKEPITEEHVLKKLRKNGAVFG